MTAALNKSSLVLDMSWQAINALSVRRALKVVSSDRARIVDMHSDDEHRFSTYDLPTWITASLPGLEDDFMNTSRGLIRIPEVIVLKKGHKLRFREVKLNRRNLYRRDNGYCQYCGCKLRHDDWSIDHVVPRSKGGRTVWQNVVVACCACNTRKANRTLAETGMRLRRTILVDGKLRTRFYDKPRRPKANAAFAISPEQRPESWKYFIKDEELDEAARDAQVSEAFWNVELTD